MACGCGKAIKFLYRDYDDDYYLWEIMEMLRRLVLVGIFVLIERGSVTQLVAGTLFCAVYLLLQVLRAAMARPCVDPVA